MRNLGERARGKHRSCPDTELFVLAANGAHRPDYVIGVDEGSGRDEPVRVMLERELGGLVRDTDDASFDSEPIHFLQRRGHRIVCRQSLGSILEHVLRGELRALGVAVLGLITDEVVLLETFMRKADHRVDHRQIEQTRHNIPRSTAYDNDPRELTYCDVSTVIGGPPVSSASSARN